MRYIRMGDVRLQKDCKILDDIIFLEIDLRMFSIYVLQISYITNIKKYNVNRLKAFIHEI